MKILVLAGRYGLSGVPLAQMRFARALSAEGHNVELIYGAVNQGHTLPVSDLFKISTLNKLRVSKMFYFLVQYFKNNSPDIVFSAGDHLNVVVLSAAIFSRSKAKISCSSRVTPFDTYSNQLFSKGWFLKVVMNLVSFRADALTCVSQDMVEQYKLIFKNSKHFCIYNIIVDESSKEKMLLPNDELWFRNRDCPIIIAAGALEPWKGFSDLIHAMKYLESDCRVKLLILGDGSSRHELESLILSLDLQESIKLTGFIDNPLSYFKDSDIFVLSSHVEGLPNVLVESMMAGCTPVSTDCPTGPREVLHDGKYGYLAPMSDPKNLAKCIKKAIINPIAKEMLDHAIAPFSESTVVKKHFESLGVK
jgi:glycosyltransferase involved in cell wall biosynthesis